MALQDYFYGSAPYTDYHIDFSSIYARGQWFVASGNYDVTSVEINIKKFNAGSTPGLVTVSICTVDGSNLPNTVLDSGTFDGDAIYTGYTWQSVNLSTSLTSGTKYCITVVPAAGGAVMAGDNAPAYTGSTQWDTTGQPTPTWNTFADGIDQRFRVNGDALPEKPITPSPTNTGTNITLDETQLSWADGGGADTYNVYFGVSGSEVLQSSVQAGLTWVIPFGTLDYNITYGWRIDATNTTGTTTGDIWTFDTITFAPPVPTPTNTLNIIKRLVAAAADKIWYENI